MPKRHYKKYAAHQAPTQPNKVGEFIAPYVASLPVVQPVIKYFFFNQLSSKYWGQLIRNALDKKLAENKKTLNEIQAHQFYIFHIAAYAKKHPDKENAYRLFQHDATRYSPHPSLVHAHSISPVLVLLPFFLAIIILLINYGVSQGALNKDWGIGMVPEKKFKGKEKSDSFLSDSMMFAMVLSFALSGHCAHIISENICIKKSLEKLQLELNKLTLYPEATLNELEKNYRDHVQGQTRLNDRGLHDLLKEVNRLEKRPWLYTVDEDLHPYIKPSRLAFA